MTEPRTLETRGRLPRVWWITVVCGVLIMGPVVLAGSYLWARHQYENGPDVDGVLWRQVASVEDPFDRALYSPTAGSVTALLDALEGDRWDGSPEGADALDFSRPTLVVHDIEQDTDAVAFRVFLSSGERPGPPGQRARLPWESSAYFTCYGVTVTFTGSSPPSVAGADERACPSLLVSRMPSDSVYMVPSTFSG